ncbi:alpha-glucuronidase family glycosyl hydrolase [Paenibacillus hodogayensis]|uniref:Alpha-glucuronidase family glycosyl hydrolase n=1 Tax=Paenibacillus hodogayensis TaxID=279208 RepID=A0ABV5VYM7_9BACL
MAGIGPKLKVSIDLTQAVIVHSSTASGVEAKAVDVLIEEIAKRTGIVWKRFHETAGAGTAPIIVVGIVERLPEGFGSEWPEDMPELQSEGYMLRSDGERERPVVWVAGADARGVLYGVGKLLRALRWGEGFVELTKPLRITTSPYSKLRGHQLGYRPKNNAFDAWTVEQFDQYIRELALFGANSIELLPPRTDDRPSGPLMKMEPLAMMVRLAEVIESYGLDTWIWYPNMGEDYSDPDTIQAELAEREEIFSKLPRITALFIPGSDPGKMEPDPLFAWTEQIAQLLERYHPQAKIWLSPQIMTYHSAEWTEAFCRQVRREPDWLGGVVFGPHVDVPLPELRRLIPERYPIRRYEDITHNFHCQYPVVDWDVAYALTLGRESCNPRPLAQKHIHNVLAQHAVGTICYSEGINDDVNKFIWSDQDWDPRTPVIDTLRDYARLFVDPERADAFAQGLLALERNWVGPLAANADVEVTLRQWQRMEQEAPLGVLNNYRFQMHVLRAYFDAYTKRRLHYEKELEYAAKEALRAAPQTGSLAAVDAAERMLEQARTVPVSADFRQRCNELADELFARIGYQLTVARHFARSQGRGAFIDAIDAPLNDVRWLRVQFARIRQAEEESVRLARIEQVLDRTNPGPGGFYDHLGSSSGFRRVDPGAGWEADPGYLASPRIGHAMHVLSLPEERQIELGGIPLAWIAHANAMLDTPIVIRYDNLDPDARYTFKAVYIGETKGNTPRDCWARLTANEGLTLDEEVPIRAGTVTIRECEVPSEAVRDGKLTLTIVRLRGFKRLNVAEIWLIPESESLTNQKQRMGSP